MSKSLGNFFTVHDLLDQGYPGEVIRFVFLSTHYRKPMDWTAEKAREAEATLRKWWRQTRWVDEGDIYQPVVDALSDDLNTPKAITELHQLAHVADARTLKTTARVLGLLTDEMGQWAEDAEVAPEVAGWIEQLLGDRIAARTARNWARADEIRDLLVDAGVEVRDGQEPAWILRPDFDPAKLEALK